MALLEQELLIVNLAKLLSDKHLESETMRCALLRICEEFMFEDVYLYEMDWNHQFLYMVEQASTNARIKNVQKALSTDLFEKYGKHSNFYCDTRLQIVKEQVKLLSLFEAQSIAGEILKDENGGIYGIILLCNTEQKPLLEKKSYDNLKTALSLISKNITVQTYQNRLRFAQTALEGILDNTGIDIYVNDFYTHEILYVNESMARPYGGKDQFTGRKCWQVLFPGQTGPCEFCPERKLLDQDGNANNVYTWDYQRAFDGSWFRVFSAAFRWADGRLAHVVSSVDITDNKKNEELVRYMANYDELTNLPNRRMLVTDCEQRINQKLEKQAYLLFFDIDGFKNINDTFGHEAGDEFLVELGKFFTGIPLLKEVTYRNGGDEFVSMLGEGITAENVRDLSRFIQARFQKNWKLKSGEVKCGISIGVSHYPDDGTTAEELLRKADHAMYHVKKNGGKGVCFASELTNI